MIGPCTHCRTLNDFTEPLDTCWKCGATNITNQHFKIYNKVSENERVDEGIREPKQQIQYPVDEKFMATFAPQYRDW